MRQAPHARASISESATVQINIGGKLALNAWIIPGGLVRRRADVNLVAAEACVAME
jgi:hypothetical protein